VSSDARSIADASRPRTKASLPMAFSLFPKDLIGASRRWASRRFDHIVYWGNPPCGGHFAAFEKPDLFVQELRAGMRAIRAAHRATGRQR
jgi:hypothetical protein